jgi:hypothetical protein
MTSINWDARALSTKPIRKSEVRKLIHELYGKEIPVIFCTSPLDLLLKTGEIHRAYVEATEPRNMVEVILPDGSKASVMGLRGIQSDTNRKWEHRNNPFRPAKVLPGTKDWYRHPTKWRLKGRASNLYQTTGAWVHGFSAWKREYPKGYEKSQRVFWGTARHAYPLALTEWGVSPGRDYGHPKLESAAFAIYPCEAFALVIERPSELHFDEDDRLHRDPREGPAAAWADGAGIYALHGVVVPKIKGSVTAAKVNGYQNQEVRRVLIDLMGGPGEYLKQGQGECVQVDGYGELWKMPKAFDAPNEPLTMVKVVNSTPEPDGTYKDYFLRVPPTTKTAQEAVAWTFRINVKDYAPVAQS